MSKKGQRNLIGGDQYVAHRGPPVDEERLVGRRFKGPWHTEVDLMMSQAALADRYAGRTVERLSPDDCNVAVVGVSMEKSVEMLAATGDEVERSRARLEQLANDVTALRDVIVPLLTKQIEDLRAHRMTVTSEVNQLLVQLREIRGFFLAADYNIELDRLERLTKVCRELQALKQDGVLDMLTDVAVKLAVEKA